MLLLKYHDKKNHPLKLFCLFNQRLSKGIVVESWSFGVREEKQNLIRCQVTALAVLTVVTMDIGISEELVKFVLRQYKSMVFPVRVTVQTKINYFAS